MFAATRRPPLCQPLAAHGSASPIRRRLTIVSAGKCEQRRFVECPVATADHLLLWHDDRLTSPSRLDEVVRAGGNLVAAAWQVLFQSTANARSGEDVPTRRLYSDDRRLAGLIGPQIVFQDAVRNFNVGKRDIDNLTVAQASTTPSSVSRARPRSRERIEREEHAAARENRCPRGLIRLAAARRDNPLHAIAADGDGAANKLRKRGFQMNSNSRRPIEASLSRLELNGCAAHDVAVGQHQVGLAG